MNWLMPEPFCDIYAQVTALRERAHPKTTMFAAPGTEGVTYPRGMVMTDRPWGWLLTPDHETARAFGEAMPDDAAMARLLGYPEPKDAAMAACPAAWLRVVQACDWRGNVITDFGGAVGTRGLPFGHPRVPTVGRISGSIAAAAPWR